MSEVTQKDLAGTIALITGGSRGLGQEIQIGRISVPQS